MRVLPDDTLLLVRSMLACWGCDRRSPALLLSVPNNANASLGCPAVNTTVTRRVVAMLW
jgi:hypothetical protein